MRASILLVSVIAFHAFAAVASAQLYRFPTGANRSDVSWRQLVTEHFRIVYHDGLDSVAREAAAVAEAIYPVVTGNLGTPVAGRTPLFLSDLDDVPNAFAFGDRYMFLWMRGILDDNAPAGIRSAGRAKWLRAVITHEFTHIVIEHATETWSDAIVPSPDVPRWFNEGTARAMEPDPWTTDLDLALRVAAVNGRLGYDLLEPGVLDGTLLYETGHSLVRYLLWRFGDSVIAKILDGGKGFFGYDFARAVTQATGMSLADIRSDWFRAVTAMYAAEYAAREEAQDVSSLVTDRFPVVFGARFSPDRRRLAVIGSLGQGRPTRLYLLDVDDSLRVTGAPELLLDEPGLDAELSWSPDGARIVVGKYRYGAHRALVHDLFLVDVPSGSLERLTSNASVRDPAWSPDGSAIVAVQKRIGTDRIVLVDPATGATTPLTPDVADVQYYTPSWSPDGSQIAASVFDADGTRSIAIVPRRGGAPRLLVRESTNNRYPVWSPDGRRIAFTSHADTVPNVHVIDADGSNRRVVTAVGGGFSTVQWVPGTDSILAISFDTRDRIVPRLVAASRTAQIAPEPIVREKFTAWRTAAFARRPPEPDAIADARIVDSSGYSALLNLAPLVVAIPVIEPAVTREGAGSARAGIATFWADPQVKHLAYAYFTFTGAFEEPAGELLYTNNEYPVSARLHADYSLAFRRRLDGRDYYQRNRGVELQLDLPIADPNTLDIGHHFTLAVAHRHLEPWNGAEFERDTTGPDPIDVTLRELAAGYRYGARTVYLDLRYRRSEPALGSELDYHRVDGSVSLRIPIVAGGDLAVLGRVDGAAHFGEQVPQEELRLDEEDQLAGRALNAFGVLDLDPSYRVRGIEESAPGDRVVVASVGVQSRLPFLEDLFPLLSLFRPQTVLFAETGSAWHAASTPLERTRWRFGVGGELRTEVLPRTWLSLGLAHGIGTSWDVYLRFSQGL